MCKVFFSEILFLLCFVVGYFIVYLFMFIFYLLRVVSFVRSFVHSVWTLQISHWNTRKNSREKKKKLNNRKRRTQYPRITYRFINDDAHTSSSTSTSTLERNVYRMNKMEYIERNVMPTTTKQRQQQQFNEK